MTTAGADANKCKVSRQAWGILATILLVNVWIGKGKLIELAVKDSKCTSMDIFFLYILLLDARSTNYWYFLYE